MNEPVCKVTVLTPRSSPTARVARRACGHARLEASRPCTAPLCNQLRQRDILQWQTWKQKAAWEAAAHRSVPAGQRHTPLQVLVQLHLRLVTGWTQAGLSQACTQQGATAFTRAAPGSLLPFTTLPPAGSVLPATAATWPPASPGRAVPRSFLIADSQASSKRSASFRISKDDANSLFKWVEAFINVSGLRNLTSAARTAELPPNYTAEQRMIHVSSSPAPSPPSSLV